MSCARGDRTGDGCLQLEPRVLKQGVAIALSTLTTTTLPATNDVRRTTTPNDGGTTNHAAGGRLLRSTAV